MALSSSSTYAQIEAEYLDTANYVASNSPSMARRHAVAIRFLLLRAPMESEKGSNRVRYDQQRWQIELEKAEGFARARDSASVRRADFSNMRAYG